MARPSIFTPDLAERICTLIAQGHSKRQIGEMDGLPSRGTIDEWLLIHEGFSSQYARACEIRAEGHAEELVDIADNREIPADHKRLMLDARKWSASKLLPKYSDRSEVTHKGEISVKPQEMTKEQIVARLAALQAE